MISATGLAGLIGAVVLGLVLAYAILRNRKRNPRNDAIGDAAALEQMRHPDSYDPKPFRDKLEQNSDGTIPR